VRRRCCSAAIHASSREGDPLPADEGHAKQKGRNTPKVAQMNIACPLCGKAPPSRPFILGCTHVLCDLCSTQSAQCPVCAASVTAAAPAWEERERQQSYVPSPSSSTTLGSLALADLSAIVGSQKRAPDGPHAAYAALTIKVKYMSATFEVDLHREAHELLHDRLSGMFAIPIDRLKVVHKGKILPTLAEELDHLIRPGMIVQLVGSRADKAQMVAAPGWLSRLIYPINSALIPLLSHAAWKDYARALKDWAWAVPRLVFLFVRSLFLQEPRE